MRGPLCRPSVEALEDRLAPSTLDLLSSATQEVVAAVTAPAIVQTADASVIKVADVVHDVLDRAGDGLLQSPLGQEVSAAVADIHAELRAEDSHGNGVGIGVQVNTPYPDKAPEPLDAQQISTPITLAVSFPSLRSATLSATVAPDHGSHLVASTVVKPHETAATASVARVSAEANAHLAHPSLAAANAGAHENVLAIEAPAAFGMVPPGTAPQWGPAIADLSVPAIFAGQPGQPSLIAAPDLSGRPGEMLFGGWHGAVGAAVLEEAGEAIDEPTVRVELAVPENDSAAVETMAPESFSALSDAAPLNLAAMEAALQQFLDQLDELRQQVGGWLADVGPTPWLLMGLAVAAALQEGVRRRLRQARVEDSRHWFPGLNGPVEAA